MTNAIRCFILFASIHDVTAAERRVRDGGVWCDLVPTPHALSTDCGMTLEVRESDVPRALSLVGQPESGCRGAYCLVGKEYVRRA